MKLFSIRVKELHEPIVLRRKHDALLFFFKIIFIEIPIFQEKILTLAEYD